MPMFLLTSATGMGSVPRANRARGNRLLVGPPAETAASCETAGRGASVVPERDRRLTTVVDVDLLPASSVEQRNQGNWIHRSMILRECSMSPRLLTIGADVFRESLTDVPLTAEDLLTEIGVAAEPYYHMLWATCSREEKLALQQLAQEDAVNPANRHVIERLLASGLVRRAPLFRLMNEPSAASRCCSGVARRSEGVKREGVELPGSATDSLAPSRSWRPRSLPDAAATARRVDRLRAGAVPPRRPRQDVRRGILGSHAGARKATHSPRLSKPP
jgi:hypothetical protein